MKLVATKAWILWGALADGKRQHVRDLAQLIGCDAHALYGQWKQLPNEIQKQLRQHDGWWQLKQAMAVVSPVQAASISDNTGFQVEVLPETTS
ncbi:MAG: bifunctional biotin--[acetyl-CoA-carboxylase] ligase/pantothenate kinase, partial [Vitreoscilla sp.]|nr:bifunctional biotin--[acetyl-CoA-carboxylase] ligase/pantothenate kinase [Vitreoscilla sp.]